MNSDGNHTNSHRSCGGSANWRGGDRPTPVCRTGEKCEQFGCWHQHPPGRKPDCLFGKECWNKDCEGNHPLTNPVHHPPGTPELCSSDPFDFDSDSDSDPFDFDFNSKPFNPFDFERYLFKLEVQRLKDQLKDQFELEVERLKDHFELQVKQLRELELYDQHPPGSPEPNSYDDETQWFHDLEESERLNEAEDKRRAEAEELAEEAHFRDPNLLCEVEDQILHRLWKRQGR